MVGVVGDDEHARWLIERFQQDNVDTGGVRAMRQYADGRTASTGTAVQVVMGTLRTGDKVRTANNTRVENKLGGQKYEAESETNRMGRTQTGWVRDRLERGREGTIC